MIGDFSRTFQRLTPRRSIVPLPTVRPAPDARHSLSRLLNTAAAEQNQAETFTFKHAAPGEKEEACSTKHPI
jgi:hypothetical protein